MKSYEEATEVSKQIVKACEDCPFRRVALAGWLGKKTPADYCQMAHSDDVIECHTKVMDGEPVLCAGAAIYRANVAKRADFRLPADKTTVFASPVEFLEHHMRKKLTPKKMRTLMIEALEKRIRESQ